MNPVARPDYQIESRKSWCRQGGDLLRSLMGLLQTVKIHQSNNKLVSEGLEALRQAVNALCIDDDHVSMAIVHGRFFLNDEKFPYQPMIESLIKNFHTYCRRRHLQGISLRMTINETDDNLIINSVFLLNNAALEDDPQKKLSQHLEQGNLPWINLIFIKDNKFEEDNLSTFATSNDPLDKTDHESTLADQLTELDPTEITASTETTARQRVTVSYCSALASVKNVADKVFVQQRVGIRQASRLIQNMVDLVLDKEALFLAMTTIRVYDDYTFTHSANVAILSMCLGKKLGLSKRLLSRLGLCGLFHDLGKVAIPKEVLNKEGKLTEEEMSIMRSHPLNSVEQILKLRAPQEMKAQIILPPFEHHLRYDLSGYPQVNWQNPVSLFGRILAIADVFDAITSPRIYRPTALSQDKALGYMLEGSGTDFDPLLLKVFINMMGVYPVGTLLELDTGELGLVVKTPDDAEESRPVVILLEQDDHGQYIKGKTINLNARETETGNFLRNISKTHHPSTYDIQPAAFIL
ncbi:MAG: HD domain-containing protein [Xanthomonadaceae bacterium]|nr:HD domain-containing protein [Xanthomonadaceae bacterium]